MKFIPNEIMIMFSRFLVLIWFLIIKTFNLKYLVGERYKGWISRPPLSVYSSVIKHLALVYMPWMSWIHILKCVSYVAIYMEIHGYICYLVNARIMKFISNEIRIMFSRFLALLWFLILKTFNLKYLVGERYKGWISWPSLSIHSSVG